MTAKRRFENAYRIVRAWGSGRISDAEFRRYTCTMPDRLFAAAMNTYFSTPRTAPKRS